MRRRHTFDDVAFGVMGDDVFPAADAVGLALAEHNAALGIHFFEQHFDLFAGDDLVRRIEVGCIDDAFALEAQLDDHVVAELRDDLAFDDCAGDEGFDLGFKDFVQKLLVFVAEEQLNFLLHQFFGQPQFADDVTIYHCTDSPVESVTEPFGAPHLRRQARPLFKKMVFKKTH